jgi:hypothetical protein
MPNNGIVPPCSALAVRVEFTQHTAGWSPNVAPTEHRHRRAVVIAPATTKVAVPRAGAPQSCPGSSGMVDTG